jgi:GxxExxY protein
VNEKGTEELKSIPAVRDVHKKQLLTYLKRSGVKLELLINFGEALIKSGVTRVVNGL